MKDNEKKNRLLQQMKTENQLIKFHIENKPLVVVNHPLIHYNLYRRLFFKKTFIFSSNV